VAAHIDIMPTRLDAASVDRPPGVRFDGRRILPLLESRKVDWPDRTLFIQSHRGDEPVLFHNVAIRNQRWKLIYPTGFGTEQIPRAVQVGLYDITADPLEMNNLAEAHPEIVKGLGEAYTAWFEDVSSTRPENFDPPRIIIGSDEGTTTVLTRQDWRVSQPDGWGRNGKWLLHAQQDAEYDVELRWPPAIAPSLVEVRAGESTRAMPVNESTTSVTFAKFRIPKGNLELAVTVSRGNTQEGAYHVLLHRLEIK
jgi:arylsulfatase/arylsulfatase A